MNLAHEPSDPGEIARQQPAAELDFFLQQVDRPPMTF